ncbi:MAG: hypothetical protein Tsb0017_07550 [Geothermobacteraceae bacterium]
MNLAISGTCQGFSRFDSIVGDALADLFAGMIPLPLEPAGCAEARPEDFSDCYSALIGFVGDLRGMVGIHCDSCLAQACYQAMLGLDEKGSPEEVRDLVGEMANILAGGIKSGLLQVGDAIDIAVPQLFSGSVYQVHLPAGGNWAGWYFQVDGSRMLVELKLLD